MTLSVASSFLATPFLPAPPHSPPRSLFLSIPPSLLLCPVHFFYEKEATAAQDLDREKSKRAPCSSSFSLPPRHDLRKECFLLVCRIILALLTARFRFGCLPACEGLIDSLRCCSIGAHWRCSTSAATTKGMRFLCC